MKKILIACAALSAVASASAQNLAAYYEFDSNLNSEIGGTALSQFGLTPTYSSEMINGVMHSVATFSKGSGSGQASGSDTAFGWDRSFGPNGGAGATRANRYSVLMDIKIDTLSGWQALTQTNATWDTGTGTDGDWFINGDPGLGISGDYTDAGNSLRFQTGVWQRLVLTIDTESPNQYVSYIDGAVQNVVGGPSGWGFDGRHSMGDKFFIFADEDGEYSGGLISSIAIFDGTLSANQVAALGVAGGAVPEPATFALLGFGAAALLRRRSRQ